MLQETPNKPLERLLAVLYQVAAPYDLARDLLGRLLPRAEVVLDHFNEYLEDLEVRAIWSSAGLDQESREALYALKDESATYADFLYEAEFGDIATSGAEARYGFAGLPLLAYTLVKVAMETEWREMAISGWRDPNDPTPALKTDHGPGNVPTRSPVMEPALSPFPGPSPSRPDTAMPSRPIIIPSIERYRGAFFS